jgi:hypothetical protein
MDASDLLIQQMRTEVQSVQENLSSGRAKDYADYQYLCGKIRGLLIAIELIDDLKQKMENSDE